jgi:predicted metal-dependent hydrolase
VDDDDAFDDALLRGARLFDTQAFFAAHEAWEQRWLGETREEPRRLIQGLIQIAAGFHKRLSRNAVGSASRLLTRGLAKLDGCPTLVRALGLGPFADEVRACASAPALASLDPARIPTLDLEARRTGLR